MGVFLIPNVNNQIMWAIFEERKFERGEIISLHCAVSKTHDAPVHFHYNSRNNAKFTQAKSANYCTKPAANERPATNCRYQGLHFSCQGGF